MSDEHYPGEADESAAAEASCTEPMTPHTLTREQVERFIEMIVRVGGLSPAQDALLDQIKATDAALRQALAQQAQEVERLKANQRREPTENETVCHACDGSGWVDR